MMVDMSPESVGQRLRLMGELWELSVALMKAKAASSEPPSLENNEAQGEDDDCDTGQNREPW